MSRRDWEQCSTSKCSGKCVSEFCPRYWTCRKHTGSEHPSWNDISTMPPQRGSEAVPQPKKKKKRKAVNPWRESLLWHFKYLPIFHSDTIYDLLGNIGLVKRIGPGPAGSGMQRRSVELSRSTCLSPLAAPTLQTFEFAENKLIPWAVLHLFSITTR